MLIKTATGIFLTAYLFPLSSCYAGKHCLSLTCTYATVVCLSYFKVQQIISYDQCSCVGSRCQIAPVVRLGKLHVFLIDF